MSEKNPFGFLAESTEKEIWRKSNSYYSSSYYSSSVHVTRDGGIGINCGGHVITLPVETWHQIGAEFLCKAK